MKVMWQIPLLHLLFYCAAQTFGIQIVSVPANIEGIIDVDVKSTVSLTCSHTTSSETEDDELVWLRNGAVVKLEEGNRKGTSKLCISPAITADNGATFKCYLRKNASLEESVTLNVTYVPELSGSENITVEELEELILRCDIWANPPIKSVEWTLNDTRVDLLAGDFTMYQDGYSNQLKISLVKESVHKGTYKCSADGKYSKLFYVTVTESTMKFPVYPIIAAGVVVFCTVLLAFVSRWQKITKCCR